MCTNLVNFDKKFAKGKQWLHRTGLIRFPFHHIILTFLDHTWTHHKRSCSRCWSKAGGTCLENFAKTRHYKITKYWRFLYCQWRQEKHFCRRKSGEFCLMTDLSMKYLISYPWICSKFEVRKHNGYISFTRYLCIF